MAIHNVDGLELNVDRGPNWLFVKLRTKEDATRKRAADCGQTVVDLVAAFHLSARAGAGRVWKKCRAA